MSGSVEFCDKYTLGSIGNVLWLRFLHFLLSLKEFSDVVCVPVCVLECEATQFMLGVLFVCRIKHLHFGSHVSLLSGACG